MNIWIVTIGEPLIHDRSNLRIHRSGLLAKYLSEIKNHNVVWWTSLFNHFTKKFEFQEELDLKPNNNLTIKCLKGSGYKKNISFARYYDHYIIQKKFRKKIRGAVKPDIIICSYPTLGLCEEVLEFSLKNKVPAIIDYRDLWPEVFYDLFPKKIRFLAKIIFSPLSFRLKRVLKNVTGIVGITEKIMNTGIEKAQRKKNIFDSFFYLGYEKLTINQSTLNKYTNKWRSYGISENDGFLKICFFGTLGHQMDFDTLIHAFNNLSNKSVKLIICGSGDKEDYLKDLSRSSNIIFPGYMSALELKSLMLVSDLGVCPHIPKQMYLDTIPGKAIEYMSEGLPIITTLGNGELGKLIEQKNFGHSYKAFETESLTHLILDILKNKNLLANKRDEIISFYSQTFDKSVVYKNYSNHIEKCIKNFNL
tara:strand:+ start:141 stop:1400 length:1260 start_codon:yes stop_codon:yes gene_type:complete